MGLFGSITHGLSSLVGGVLGGGGSNSGGTASNQTSNTTNVTVDTKSIADAISASSAQNGSLFENISAQSNQALKHLDETLIALVATQSSGDSAATNRFNSLMQYGLFFGGALTAYYIVPTSKKGQK